MLLDVRAATGLVLPSGDNGAAIDPATGQTVAACTFTVTVNDAEPPYRYCGSEGVSIDADLGQCTWSGSFWEMFVDNCDGSLPAACSPPGPYPVGQTTMTCSVTDSSGNTGSCNWTLTVRDNQPPTITCPSNLTAGTDPGQCGATVSLSDWLTATDNCAVGGIACGPIPPNNFFPIGTTTITCTATDIHGNPSAPCTFTVTVLDSDPPTLTCPGNITVGNDPGQCGAAVDTTVDHVDNCPGPLTISYSPPLGSFFPVGTTPVTVTATDAAGNQTTCTFTVTVEDRDPPTLTCPSDITVPTDSGQCGATVNYVAPTGSDNCGVPSYSFSPPNGSFFPIGQTPVTVTATDASGNQTTCTFPVTVEDREPPTITCSDVAVPNDPGQCGAQVTFLATPADNCPGVTVSYSSASGSFFPVGTTSVTATATDAAGHTDTCQFTVTVNDTEAPTMTCRQDIVTTNDPRRADANVNYPMLSAHDNCSGVQVNCSPPPHTPFPIGVTQVTCTATDVANNTFSCSFAVKVMPVWPTLVSSTFQIRTGGASASFELVEQNAWLTSPVRDETFIVGTVPFLRRNPVRGDMSLLTELSRGVERADYPHAAPPEPLSDRLRDGQSPAEPGLVVADCLTNEVKAFVSNRDGTFRLSQRLRVGDMPSAVAVGDFNRDGNTDVATANVLSDDVSMLLGNGGGSFRDFGSVPVGHHPRAIVVGDFTSDGRLDLAVANLSDNDIMLLRGHGDGSFESGVHSAVEIEPTAIAAGDFNRDTRLDLAVSNFDSDTITVLMGRGDGRFTPSGSFPVGAGPMALTAGDFDNDGRLDLATANFTSGTISILKNTDGQRFSEARRLPTGTGPVALVAGRLLNQHLGLAAGNLLAGEIVIRLGDPTGTLGTLQRYAVTAAPASVTAGDFNQDGRLDLSVLDADGITLRVLLDNGNGAFRLVP